MQGLPPRLPGSMVILLLSTNMGYPLLSMPSAASVCSLVLRNADSCQRKRIPRSGFDSPYVFSETAAGDRTGAPTYPEGVLRSHSVTGSERNRFGTVSGTICVRWLKGKMADCRNCFLVQPGNEQHSRAR